MRCIWARRAPARRARDPRSAAPRRSWSNRRRAGPRRLRLARAQAPASGTAFAVPSAGVVVVATWSAHPSTIEQALDRRVSATPPAPAPRAAVSNGALHPSRNAAIAPSTTLGFDTCAAPSLAAMAAWGSSPYRTIGVYLGGANSACAQPNLTAAWVQTVTGAGWRLIPTYVGLQGAGIVRRRLREHRRRARRRPRGSPRPTTLRRRPPHWGSRPAIRSTTTWSSTRPAAPAPPR